MCGGGCNVGAYRRLGPGALGHDVEAIDYWPVLVGGFSYGLRIAEVDSGEDFGFAGTVGFGRLGGGGEEIAVEGFFDCGEE